MTFCTIYGTSQKGLQKLTQVFARYDELVPRFQVWCKAFEALGVSGRRLVSDVFVIMVGWEQCTVASEIVLMIDEDDWDEWQIEWRRLFKDS